MLPGDKLNVARKRRLNMFAIMFADSDWFGGVCCWGFFIFWLMALGIGDAVTGIGKAAKKIAENETAQEVGKGVLASWLESYFKK